MTSKGQVTVPKDIRDALRLIPGRAVRFELDDEGGARILPAPVDDEVSRIAEFRARVAKAQVIFKANDAFPGMTTDEYMAMIREPLQPWEAAAK